MHGFANWKLAVAGLAVAFMASWTTASAQTQQDYDALKKKNQELETRLGKVETVNAGNSLSATQKAETKALVEEMLKSAKSDVTGPDWAKNLRFSGDFRLRYEARMFNRGNNNITGTQFNNNFGGFSGFANGVGNWPVGSTPAFYNFADRDVRYKVRDRDFVQFRLRFGAERTWTDADLGEFKVEFRLASGASNDPTTANQTLGSMSDNGQTAAGYAKRPIWIDLAYATYSPKFLPGMSVTAGKMRNPFFNACNDIYWDSDVNPEGVWVKYAPSLMDGKLVPWFGTGLFMISEQSNLWADSIMFAYELGVSYKVTDDVKVSFAAKYLDYQHYDSASNNMYRGNAPGPIPFLGAGAVGYPGVNPADALNNGLSPTYAYGDNDFGVIDLITKVEFNVPIGSYKLPIEVWFDWAHNCKDSYNQSQFIAFNQLSGTPTAWAAAYNSGMDPVSTMGQYNRNYVDANDAYAVGIKAGKNVKKGDWSVGYKFAYIQANAMPGEWIDSTFGSANRKGHVLTACYNLMDDLTIGANLYITQPVYSPDTIQNVMVDGANPVGLTGISPIYTDWVAGEDKCVLLQAELIWKF